MKKDLFVNSRILLIALFLFTGSLTFGQKKYVIESKNLKTNDTVLVFTPNGWDTDSKESKPALFLLHGWSGCWSDWSKKTDLQSFSDKYGFIIITPDGFYNGWYLNNIDPDKMQWRTFFDKELYPIMVKNYNLDPEKTFITGLSMGGHGAINIFLDDVKRFRAAGSMSGVLNLMDTRLKSSQITEVLGPYSDDAPNFANSSALNRLESIKGTDKIMLITCGAQDGLAKSAIDFTKRCDELKIPNILMLSPGVHSWKYWIYALDLHLFIFSRIVNNQELGY
ncbi:MAG: alpha/beta hydrolase family protein [Rikenellaceae bacterium]